MRPLVTEGSRLFTRGFVRLPTTPLRILERGGTKAQAGWFLAACTCASAFVAPVMGALADPLGRKRRRSGDEPLSRRVRIRRGHRLCRHAVARSRDRPAIAFLHRIRDHDPRDAHPHSAPRRPVRAHAHLSTRPFSYSARAAAAPFRRKPGEHHRLRHPLRARFGGAYPAFTTFVLGYTDPRRRGSTFGSVIWAFDTGTVPGLS